MMADTLLVKDIMTKGVRVTGPDSSVRARIQARVFSAPNLDSPLMDVIRSEFSEIRSMEWQARARNEFSEQEKYQLFVRPA